MSDYRLGSLLATLLQLWVTVAAAARHDSWGSELAPDQRVVAFYYVWYGAPAVDGDYKHWNHE